MQYIRYTHFIVFGILCPPVYICTSIVYFVEVAVVVVRIEVLRLNYNRAAQQRLAEQTHI